MARTSALTLSGQARMIDLDGSRELPIPTERETSMRAPWPTAFIALLLLVGPAAAIAEEPPQAGGTFEVTIDFATLSLTPVGANCLLEVEGAVEFEGTLEGQASSVTTALVRAACSEVVASPPGTFPDVFSARLQFAGTFDGVPVEAGIVYRGTAEVGGSIRGVMILSDGLRGALRVDAILAEGGSYQGRGVLR
jgi:hypothetical protein